VRLAGPGGDARRGDAHGECYLRPIASRALVTGATGFIGGRLAAALARSGAEVRCLVRDPSRASALRAAGCEIRRGDVTDAASLEGAGGGEIDVAYFLVHAMAGGEGFEEREREGARNFARMAKREGVRRLVYLGGLGEESVSKHLASRHETARILAAEGPPLTYFRAAMVVGAQSESYRTLRYLVKRLPVMIAPAWLKTTTQPIGVEDVIEYLRRAPEVAASEGREVQIGGPDVLSYGAMLDRMALVMGIRPRPKLPMPFITPWLSALWLGLVTPVDTTVARPLVEGLRTATVVTDPSGARPFGIDPAPFDETLRRALEEDAGRR
jgi:uncharacterized protein YbjT (DUF2867 family)